MSISVMRCSFSRYIQPSQWVFANFKTHLPVFLNRHNCISIKADDWLPVNVFKKTNASIILPTFYETICHIGIKSVGWTKMTLRVEFFHEISSVAKHAKTHGSNILRLAHYRGVSAPRHTVHLPMTFFRNEVATIERKPPCHTKQYPMPYYAKKDATGFSSNVAISETSENNRKCSCLSALPLSPTALALFAAFNADLLHSVSGACLRYAAALAPIKLFSPVISGYLPHQCCACRHTLAGVLS